MHDENYAQKLLAGWEEIHRMGQLTLWIMLALKLEPSDTVGLGATIDRLSSGTMLPDKQSLYRSLRRYCQTEMIDFDLEPTNKGPDRKIYKLTPLGQKVLDSFVDKNIRHVYSNPEVRKLLNI